VDSDQDSDLAPSFGYLSQSEKLSEIKPPLKNYPLHQAISEIKLAFQ